MYSSAPVLRSCPSALRVFIREEWPDVPGQGLKRAELEDQASIARAPLHMLLAKMPGRQRKTPKDGSGVVLELFVQVAHLLSSR